MSSKPQKPAPSPKKSGWRKKAKWGAFGILFMVGLFVVSKIWTIGGPAQESPAATPTAQVSTPSSAQTLTSTDASRGILFQFPVCGDGFHVQQPGVRVPVVVLDVRFIADGSAEFLTQDSYGVQLWTKRGEAEVRFPAPCGSTFDLTKYQVKKVSTPSVELASQDSLQLPMCAVIYQYDHPYRRLPVVVRDARFSDGAREIVIFGYDGQQRTLNLNLDWRAEAWPCPPDANLQRFERKLVTVQKVSAAATAAFTSVAPQAISQSSSGTADPAPEVPTGILLLICCGLPLLIGAAGVGLYYLWKAGQKAAAQAATASAAFNRPLPAEADRVIPSDYRDLFDLVYAAEQQGVPLTVEALVAKGYLKEAAVASINWLRGESVLDADARVVPSGSALLYYKLQSLPEEATSAN